MINKNEIAILEKLFGNFCTSFLNNEFHVKYKASSRKDIFFSIEKIGSPKIDLTLTKTDDIMNYKYVTISIHSRNFNSTMCISREIEYLFDTVVSRVAEIEEEKRQKTLDMIDFLCSGQSALDLIEKTPFRAAWSRKNGKFLKINSDLTVSSVSLDEANTIKSLNATFQGIFVTQREWYDTLYDLIKDMKMKIEREYKAKVDYISVSPEIAAIVECLSFFSMTLEERENLIGEFGDLGIKIYKDPFAPVSKIYLGIEGKKQDAGIIDVFDLDFVSSEDGRVMKIED